MFSVLRGEDCAFCRHVLVSAFATVTIITASITAGVESLVIH